MIWVVTTFAVLLIVGGAGWMSVVVNNRQKQKQRLMSVVTRNMELGSKETSQDKQLAKQRADIARKLKEATAEKEKQKKDKASIKDLLMQAGIEASLSKFWLVSLLSAVGVYALCILLTSFSTAIIVLNTVTAFFGLPRLILKFRIKRRQKKFLTEFPDALDASVRLLQAGMPISEAIAMVGREYVGPLREEMIRMYESQKVGISIGDAAKEMAQRIPLTEVHMFATALQIQSETGSSLSEVLSNLSNVIRARFRLQRKVKALSSEAKSSAAIIGALPVLVTIGLYFANKPYIMILFETDSGHWLIGGALMWMCVGILVMRQMINFKI